MNGAACMSSASQGRRLSVEHAAELSSLIPRAGVPPAKDEDED